MPSPLVYDVSTVVRQLRGVARNKKKKAFNNRFSNTLSNMRYPVHPLRSMLASKYK